MMPPPAAGDTAIPTKSAAVALAAYPSPDVVVDTVDDTTAATASAADIGMDADTDPSPAVVALPTTEHISSFLLHIRRRVAGDDTATAASAAEALVTPPLPWCER